MFDWLVDAVSGSAVTHLVVLAASGGDVLFPVIPSETMVVTAGVIAGRGELSIWLLVPAAAIGAFAGDNVSYWLGRRLGDAMARRLFRGEKGRRRLAWAQRAIDRRGGLLILVGRFIPGGRTAATFAAGSLEMSWRRFAAADAVAVSVWALYAALLGYAGGATFGDSSWKPFAASLGMAGVVMAAAEVYRRVQRSRGRDVLGDDLE